MSDITLLSDIVDSLFLQGYYMEEIIAMIDATA